MKRLLIFAIASLGLLIGANQIMALDLKEIPGIVRDKNYKLKEAKSQLEADKADRSQAMRRYLPEINLNSSFTRLNDDIVLDIGPKHIERDILDGKVNIAFDIDPPPILIQEKNISRSAIELKQPIYTGGLIEAGIDAAEADVALSHASTAQVYDEELAKALSRYFEAKLAAEVVDVLNEIDSSLAQLVRIAQALVDQGVQAEYAVLQVKAQKAEVEARLKEAENSEVLVRTVLAYLLVKEKVDREELTDPLVVVDLNESAETFLKSAQEKRPEFAIIDAQKRKLEALDTKADANLLPKVFGFGKYELLDHDRTIMDPKWLVGVGVNIPLTGAISYFPEKTKSAELGIKLDQAGIRAKEEIGLQVRNAFMGCQNLRRALKAITESQKLADESYRLARVRLEAGKGSTIEVLQSFTQWQQTKLKRLQLIQSYNQSMIDLYKSSGMLTLYIDTYKTQLARKETP